MRIRVLGCHGGETREHRATSFLIDDSIIIDAGALTGALTVPEQLEIEHIFISHSHLDHIRDIALFGDNVIAARKSPTTIHCADATAEALEKHIFNNVIWPDFTKIPNPTDPENRPTLRIDRFNPDETMRVEPYSITAVQVNHPVHCQAHIVTGPTGSFAYSGDTGPTDALWKHLNKQSDLRAYVHEVSFPNDMTGLAEVSGHLTPAMLGEEIRKLKGHDTMPIYLYHGKPGFDDVLEKQVAAIGDKRLRFLAPGDVIEI